MPEYAQNEPEKAISKHVFSVYSDGVCKGEAERSRKWGVGGSLRQNRCFAADSPLAPTHTLFLVIDSFLLVVSEVLLLASGAPFRTRKQKRVFPLATSYPLLLLRDANVAKDIPILKTVACRSRLETHC